MITPIDLKKLKVFPLEERTSLTRADEILLDPNAPSAPLLPLQAEGVSRCAVDIQAARDRGAAVVLFYGAHLLRNGAAAILGEMMKRGLLTHLATNGAGTIHDWEYAWLGRSTEGVQANVATGTFGTWNETGRSIHTAILAGALRGEGYGVALGRFIAEDGVEIPGADHLETSIRSEPGHPLTAARAELLQAIREHGLPSGRLNVEHRWKHASILCRAFQSGIPVTVHPGIGYDIIANHPMFTGSSIGRAAGLDFRLLGGSVEELDGGVVLSIGSAIMGPQVFEKILSCVNNLRIQAGRQIVSGHSIHVVDIQDGGGWDWSTQGEPPKTNPAYYLRFCKSFSRMGARMHYHQCDNAAFMQSLFHRLSGPTAQ
jgi:hypothetical protein